MNGYECVRCECPGYHAAWTPEREPIGCAAHGCTDYRPSHAWTAESVERSIIAEAVQALRQGKDPAKVLRMLEAA